MGERFGAYHKTLDPGFHCLGLDCCACCISLKGVSNRVVQQEVDVFAKRPESFDGLLVNVRVAVQLQVNADSPLGAFYRLSDVKGQVDAVVTDAVQAAVQRRGSGSVKQRIEAMVKQRLQAVFDSWPGYNVTKTLCTGYFFADKGVADADRQIAQERNRVESMKVEADAAKITTVKAAEADSDAKALQGEGIARQRAAIAEGLRDSFLAHGGDKPSVSTISELLLISEHFDTLKAIGRGPQSSTIFLPQESAPAQSEMTCSASPGQVTIV